MRKTTREEKIVRPGVYMTDDDDDTQGYLASQPKREWVGLTFAEICECENEYLHLFARAIEAKLKEKNT